MPGRGRGSGVTGIVKGTKLTVDPGVAKARSAFAAAIRENDEDKAAETARELVKARREAKVRAAREVLVAAGYRVEGDES
jgi:hypothetical protein